MKKHTFIGTLAAALVLSASVLTACGSAPTAEPQPESEVISSMAAVSEIPSALPAEPALDESLLDTPDLCPVRGVDVSEYQGDIDWEILAQQGIDFAFLKATEGTDYVDPYFAQNYENAKKTGLRIGAYHFFSFESSGAAQAENFCNTVTAFDGMLPPVADVEYYGDFESLTAEQVTAIRREMTAFLTALEQHYGQKPILYCSEESYADLVQGHFDEYDLWISNFKTKPDSDLDWTFWQYSDTHTFPGYDGTEQCIDVNIFRGTKALWERYPD